MSAECARWNGTLLLSGSEAQSGGARFGTGFDSLENFCWGRRAQISKGGPQLPRCCREQNQNDHIVHGTVGKSKWALRCCEAFSERPGSVSKQGTSDAEQVKAARLIHRELAQLARL
jgi:hypothetical protein